MSLFFSVLHALAEMGEFSPTWCTGEFVEYLQYCRSLEYAEKPDYQYLKDLLKSVFVSHGFQMDYMFDWVLKQRVGTVVSFSPLRFLLLCCGFF